MNNLIIRGALLKNGVRYWQLARILGISEPTLCRKLRTEIPEPEQMEIAARIESEAAKLQKG